MTWVIIHHHHDGRANDRPEFGFKRGLYEIELRARSGTVRIVQGYDKANWRWREVGDLWIDHSGWQLPGHVINQELKILRIETERFETEHERVVHVECCDRVVTRVDRVSDDGRLKEHIDIWRRQRDKTVVNILADGAVHRRVAVGEHVVVLQAGRIVQW